MAQLMYPIGIQAFSEIRREGYVYIDKTEYIHKLLTTGKYYFLSRPRRFGKSLLLSTIEALFEGRKDFFNGLAIDAINYDWERHPVLHLDFSAKNYDTEESLLQQLNSSLEIWEHIYGNEKHDRSPEERFSYAIRRAHEISGKRVVILIDEYDKPLLETIDRPELQEKYRNILRGVYGNLKKQDANIRFAMLTGVTRFGRLSIFSDLNNLNDISLDEEFSGICGITENELQRYLHSGVMEFAAKKGISIDAMYRDLKSRYDGYHFSTEESPDIYNPFSLLCALRKKKLAGYWFSTGTPNFLAKMILEQGLSVRNLDNLKINISAIEDVALDLWSDIYPVLYQTGYLTIKGYDPVTDQATLGFPNREVEEAFLNCLIDMSLKKTATSTTFSIGNFYNDVLAGNVDAFMQRLKSLMADFNHDGFNHIPLEQHYQDVLFILAKLLGFITHVEYKTSSGRIDMVVRTPMIIYVFEFKLDKSAKEALDQINEKEYLIPFQADGRNIIKIGVDFSSKTHTINDWVTD